MNLGNFLDFSELAYSSAKQGKYQHPYPELAVRIKGDCICKGLTKCYPLAGKCYVYNLVYNYVYNLALKQ